MDGLTEARRLIAHERDARTGTLDLGNLGLKEVPREVFELAHLTVLNLGHGWRTASGDYFLSRQRGSSNAIHDISLTPDWLPNLRCLGIRNQPISDLAFLRGTPHLTSLDCCASRVSDLEPLRFSAQLEMLDCAVTSVADLSPLRSTQSLRVLRCGHTHIADVGTIGNHGSLRLLNCQYTRLLNLSSMPGFSALEHLECGGNAITDLAPLAGLSSLRLLDVAGTSIEDLAPLQALTGLDTLVCSSTAIATLTPLGGLRALRSLNCSSTAVGDLSVLSTLSALQSLSCQATRIADLSPFEGLRGLRALDFAHTSINDLSRLRGLEVLEELNCSDTDVIDLSPLALLSGLRRLRLAATQVDSLAPIATLTELRSLDCSSTRVTDLAPLASMKSLASLDCSSTQITDIAPLRGLSSLESLACSNTSISDFGPLEALKRLRSLTCSSTLVADLTPLRSLPALSSVDCSDTPVRDVTPLVTLPGPLRLALNHCNLADLPRGLVLGETVHALYLANASVLGVPTELLSEGEFDSCIRRLQDHFRDLDAGVEVVSEAKVVVVGNGRVGKTQISRRLRGLDFDTRIASTHGITVTPADWKAAANVDALNIWDFGGQDIYHGTHTLFMKTRAVFVIVWHPDFEARSEETHEGLTFRNYPLSYWLEYVRTLAHGDCPVVVVQTRCERPEDEVRRLPVDDEFLRFRSLKQCWYSAKTNRGRGALDDALGDAIASLRDREGVSTIGAGRMRVLKQLETWRTEDQERALEDRLHRTLTQIEFRALCDEAGGVSSPDSLLDYLHNVGVVFYRPTLFADRIILDQSWALAAVYAVFEREKSFRQILGQGGHFTRGFLELLVWGDYSANQQLLFLSLMQSCGIAFVHRKADERLGLEPEYVAPDLLPDREAVAAQMVGRWSDDEESWQLEYTYPFLHQGLVRGLICDAGQRANDAGVYWKYGCWVYERDSGCRALIEQQMSDERRGRITVRVQGRRHEHLAAWLRARFDERNRLFGYPKLTPTIDELARPLADDEARRRPATVAQALTTSESARAEELVAKSEPQFGKPPATTFPSRQRQIYVSYAWGDETPSGRARSGLVDDLCTALASATSPSCATVVR
jgi:internalin A